MPKVPQEYLDARKREILQAAVRCFAERGFHGTTMQDVADEAGLSKGALYRYVESKDDLVEALARERTAPEPGELAGAADREATALEGLVAAASSLVAELGTDQAEKSAWVTLQLWAESADTPELLELLEGSYRENLEALRPVVERARREGALPEACDADQVARVLLGFLQGAVFLHTLDPGVDGESVRRALEALVLRKADG